MLHSLVQRLHDTPLAFVDVETTGASTDFGHRVIELGIARVEQGRVVGELNQLINPGRRISPGVTALTGISDAMVADMPDFAAQLPAALPLLKDAVIIGHNIRFDLGFLRREFRRARQEMIDVLGDVAVFDTVRIARRRFGRGGNGLQRLARRLDYLPPVAHRALPDAITTFEVFSRMLAPVGGSSMCLIDVIREQGAPMKLSTSTSNQGLLPLELEEALDQKCPVMMEYLDARQKPTSRAIVPIHLRKVAEELILVAHCQLRNDRRTFKLDRIVALTRIDNEPNLFSGFGVPEAVSEPSAPVANLAVDVAKPSSMLQSPGGAEQPHA